MQRRDGCIVIFEDVVVFEDDDDQRQRFMSCFFCFLSVVFVMDLFNNSSISGDTVSDNMDVLDIDPCAISVPLPQSPINMQLQHIMMSMSTSSPIESARNWLRSLPLPRSIPRAIPIIHYGERLSKGGWQLFKMYLTMAIVSGMFHWPWYFLISIMIYGWWVNSFFISVGVCAVLYITYMTTVLTSKAHMDGSAEWPRFRKLGFFWHIIQYFPLHIVKTADIYAEDGPVIFGVSPHGIFGWAGVEFMYLNSRFHQLFPGLDPRLLVATSVTMHPMAREIFLWTGGVNASKETAVETLRGGRSIAIVIGGEREVLLSREHINKCIIKERRGFVRLALETGTRIVPCFCLGANNVAHQVTLFRPIQQWMISTLRVCIPVFYGIFGTFIPFRKPIAFVIGTPINVPGPLHPDDIDENVVTAILEEYAAQIQFMFDKYKDQFGFCHEELVIL